MDMMRTREWHNAVIEPNITMSQLSDRAVLHVDFDYFYAQCEEIRRPSLRTRPVCVCIYSDRGNDSGAIATANYTARRFGVKSGLPIYRAQRMLEGLDAEFISVDFKYYADISSEAMDIMERYANTFEYVGKDEAYLDVTERTGGSLKAAMHVAQQLKNEIRVSQGLTCSAGVSSNKLLSKIASDYKKPDGLTVVERDDTIQFLDSLKPAAVPGIGGKTLRRLTSMGASTMKEIRDLDAFTLQKTFGRKTGTRIFNSVRGIDESPVQRRPPAVQYGKIVTLKHDMLDIKEMEPTLRNLCGILHDMVSGRNMLFRLVGVQIISTDMTGRSRSRTLLNHTASRSQLEAISLELLNDIMLNATVPARRLGVKVSDLIEARGQQDITSYF